MMARIQAVMVEALHASLNSGKPVPVPHGGTLFWEWFTHLHAARTWHMNGPNPISHQEIDAYGRLYNWRFRADHIAIIRAMDDAFIADFYSKRPQTSNEPAARQPTGEMSAALFDAVFG
jgi:hypothetical protein